MDPDVFNIYIYIRVFFFLFLKNRLNKLKQKLAKLHPAGEQYEPQSHYEGILLNSVHTDLTCPAKPSLKQLKSRDRKIEARA